MTVLHIFNNSIYTTPYIEFINRNFNPEDHLFIIIKSSENMKVSDAQNVLDFVIDKKKVKTELSRTLTKAKTYTSLFIECVKADKIIIHALFDSSIIKFLFYNKWFLKKSYWVIWGADLYDSKKSKNHKKNESKEYMKSRIIRRLGGIVGLPGDREIAREKYRSKAKEFSVMYINAINKKFLDRLRKAEKNYFCIQIGNSADRSNCHIEIIDALSKFRNESIQIFAPLSYGNNDYAQEVKEYGEKIFGSKFTAMMSYMSPDNYSEYLSNIDILIFNHKRQQGLGNLYPLIYLGKKVFIRNDISSWNYVRNELDIQLYNTNEIADLDFKTFISQESISKNKNIQRSKETFYSEDYIKNLWQNIFSAKLE